MGFSCAPSEDGWHASMYLGHTEFVGGRHDGRELNPSFQVDLSPLIGRFDPLEDFRWIALPESGSDGRVIANSRVRIQGRIQGNPMVLELHSVPPADAGPGFREFPNGQRETV